MKRILLASLVLTAAVAAPSQPAQALPVWANLIAQSHCEYLSMGFTWDEAIDQALRDRSHWRSEMSAAGSNAGAILNAAVNQHCFGINNAAFSKRQAARKLTPAAY